MPKASFLPIPPPGYALERAVLTTFDFDMETLLSEIEGEDLSKFLLFRGDGLYSNAEKKDESFITPIIYTAHKKGASDKYFHPKMSLFCYRNEEGSPYYFLRIGSKNIYPFSNHEIELCFEGVLEETVQEKNEPLLDLMRLLLSAIPEGDAEKRGALEDLLSTLDKVRFSLVGPYRAEDYSFFTSYVGIPELFEEPYDELLIVSPNINPAQIRRLLYTKKEGGRCVVLSSIETVLELFEEEIIEPQYLSLPLDQFVHAKLYLIHKQGRYDLYAGSMNLTDYAVTKNDEAMVYLKGVKDIEGIAGFLSDFLGLSKEAIEEEIHQYDEVPKGDGFVENALAMRARISYIAHLLERKKYEKGEKEAAVSYLLSSASKKRIQALIQEETLDLLPLRRTLTINGKARDTFTVSFYDNLVLGCINHTLHRYDYLFSSNVYLHVAGRRPLDVFIRLHHDKEFSSLFLFRGDIHAFDPSMDEEVLLERVHMLFAFDPDLEAFLERYVRLKAYVREEGGTVYEDGPAQYTGLPLGGFLENVYLSDFDRIVEEKASFYVRCGDDIILGTKDKRKTAEVADLVISLLEERKLTMSPKKTFLLNPKEPFVYLGWRIQGDAIDFPTGYLASLEQRIRMRADRLRRFHGGRPLRLISVIKIVNAIIQENNFYSAFQYITVDEGLKRIDHMIYECIRTLGSGYRGKQKYKITHEDLQACGYQTLVNTYYKYLKRR